MLLATLLWFIRKMCILRLIKKMKYNTRNGSESNSVNSSYSIESYNSLLTIPNKQQQQQDNNVILYGV